MKLSYNWLKDFVDFELSPKEIAELVTFTGIETNVVSGGGTNWPGVITAKVLDAGKHPHADKLSLCSVTDGTKTYSIVCGAPNVGAGQTIALATVGAELPGGLKIKKAKIRGIESEGMICSEKELGLSEQSSGIMILPGDTPLGRLLKEVLGQQDTILEIEIPTNRPDTLSHLGIAREIAAKLGKKVNIPAVYSGTLPSIWKSIKINEPELCSRYIGIKISGIKVGPSPAWISDKLVKCGLRTINNIVDITNYVLLEMGHPLHAFDLAKMQGGEIVVRRANKGETMLALDGKTYNLDENMLVVADRENAQAIAGVMGGEFSGVRENTTDMILESAMFKPQNIRKTSKFLNLSSDASYRFERGTGWTVCEMAALRAVKLICEIAGGKIESMHDKVEKQYIPVKITLRPERIKKVAGMEFSKDEIVNTLAALDLKALATGHDITVEVPSWRIDLCDEIDLIEEVLRIKGYDNVPVTVMPVIPRAEKRSDELNVTGLVNDRLLTSGFSEAINYSFAEEKELKNLKLEAEVRIKNPLSQENEVMRPSLLPGLWRNLLLNLRQGYGDVKLFENGAVFLKGETETRKVGIIACGNVWPEWWGWETKLKESGFDYYYFAGVIQNILSGNRVKFKENKNCKPYFHPGKTAAIEMNGRVIGETGVLHPDISCEVDKDVCYCEIDLGVMNPCWNTSTRTYKQISRKPMVKRDMSLVADKSVAFESIREVLDKNMSSQNLLSEYELFSIYQDEKLGKDKISYSFHLVFRHPELTLTDVEVNAQFDAIVKALNIGLGITLR